MAARRDIQRTQLRVQVAVFEVTTPIGFRNMSVGCSISSPNVQVHVAGDQVFFGPIRGFDHASSVAFDILKRHAPELAADAEARTAIAWSMVLAARDSV